VIQVVVVEIAVIQVVVVEVVVVEVVVVEVVVVEVVVVEVTVVQVVVVKVAMVQVGVVQVGVVQVGVVQIGVVQVAGPYLDPETIPTISIFRGTLSGSLLSYTHYWLKLAYHSYLKGVQFKPPHALEILMQLYSLNSSAPDVLYVKPEFSLRI
jgi:hypothetical protein